jgi:hypothetical protein
VPDRTAEQVQHEIEQARDALAVTVDQLTTRTNPKRLANEAKQTAVEKAKSPAGMAAIGGAGAVVILLVVLRIRNGRKHKDD